MNYLSQPLTYSAPQESYNFDLLAKGLQYKNTQIEENASRNQALIDQYMSIDLVRDVDKNYLANRVQSFVDNYNSLNGADFSNPTIQNALQGHLKQILDPTVISAAASTKNLRTLQTQIEEVKTKNIDKYNPANEAFALRGAQAWLANPNAGAGYSGGVYTPYEDVNKTMLAVVKDLKDTKGDQVVEVKLRDGQGNYTGQIERKTIKGMTSEEIQAYLPNLIPSSTLNQLQINGWSKYQGENGLQIAQNNFDKFSKTKNSDLDKAIETARIGENSTSLSKEQRKNYSNQRQSLQQEKDNFNSNLSNVNIVDTASLGAFLETNQWLNNFSQIAGARESVEYESDDFYFDSRSLELSVARENRMAMESQLGMRKTALEIAKLENEQQAANASAISLNPLVSDIPSDLDPVTDSTQRYKELAGVVNSTVKDVYSGAPEEQKKLFDLEKSKLLEQGQAPSNANKIAFEKVFKQSNPTEYGQIINAQTEKNNIARGLKVAQDQANIEDFSQNADEYYAALRTNATLNPKTEAFLKQNNITPETLKNSNNRDLIIKTADYLKGLYNTDSDKWNREYSKETDPRVKRAMLAQRLEEGKYNFSEKNKSKINAILVEKGYSGFSTGRAANFNSETDRTIIKNSLPQTSDGFQFDEKQPMTVSPNPDGSFTVTQIKEGTKGGMLQSNLRTARVSRDSDLYNFLTSKVNPEVERNIRLSTDTPIKKPSIIDYVDANANDILNESADYILRQTSGNPMSISGTSPVNYLTSTGTNSVYIQGLSRKIPAEKINTLTRLMENNPNKFEVKAEVEKGQWKVSTTLKGATPILINRANGGTELNNKQVNLYVDQFPQITVGESLYNYLNNSPEQIDNIIESLQR